MMQEDDFDSDTSDEDFVLEKEVEHPSSSDPDTDDDVEATPNGKKRKKKTRSESPIENDTIEAEVKVEDQVKLKEKENQLWADFLNDVDEPVKVKPSVIENRLKSNTCTKKEAVKAPLSTDVPKKRNGDEDAETVKITKIFEFAGEEVRVEEEVAADSTEAKSADCHPQEAAASKGTKRAGASGLLDMLQNKRAKLTTLEKTKLDWNSFKKSEDLGDELELHKKSKSGYLEKQDFLARSDLKQFEIEKELRRINRSKR